MPHPMAGIIALAEAGELDAAESLMAEANRRQGLSGHDQQICKKVIAKAYQRAAAAEVVVPAKPKRKPRRRTTK